VVRRTRIKICGVTSPEDAALAFELGADAVGLNFHPQSSRFISLQQARAIVNALDGARGAGLGLSSNNERDHIVAVFVNINPTAIVEVHAALGGVTVQLHGDESPSVVKSLAPRTVVRAFRWASPASAQTINAYWQSCSAQYAPLAAVLLDAYRPGVPGGTGETWNWAEALAANLPSPLILAGGLTPENVGRAIRTMRPFAVDVAGGVEESPGKKSKSKLWDFIEAVRAADE
jgi:phosphoribosylanthranilate isomerase